MKTFSQLSKFSIISATTLLITSFAFSDDSTSVLLVDEPGKSVNLKPFLPGDIPAIEYEQIILPGPQFIFSDEPETIRQPVGLALRESVVPGSVRLYVYNVNGNEEDRKINSVIKNTGNESMTVEFLKFATHKPSGNYHGMAKNCLERFFKSSPEGMTMTLEPGESKPIDPELEKLVAKKSDLVHGFYEFLINQPAEISVVIGDPELSSNEISESLTEVIQIDNQKNAGRGLFGVSNYLIRNPTDSLSTADGIRQLSVADNESDPWIVGIDGSTGASVELRGNYGVLYDISLNYETPDGQGLALVTWNSRYESSKWCGGMATAIDVHNGYFPPQTVRIPSDQLVVRIPPELAVVQLYPPLPEGEQGKISFTFSPTGASCLPIPLIFVPVDFDLIDQTENEM